MTDPPRWNDLVADLTKASPPREAAVDSTIDYRPARPGPLPVDGSAISGIRPDNMVEASPRSVLRLRQRRLQAAASSLAVLQVIAMVRSLMSGEPRWPVHAAVAVAMATAATCLSRRAPIAPPRTRLFEFAIFGLMAATMSLVQYRRMLEVTAVGDAVGLMAEIKNSLIGSLILTFTYAMLIPNTWRRAATVLPFIAVSPVLVEGLLFHRHPEALQFARESRILMLSGVNFLLASFSAGLAIFGTHVLNSLRQEVLEARRLNQYQLIGSIGTGGMGDVYLAEHRLLKRTCAIKLIHPDSERDPEALRRFEREAQATARLSHPNIVEIFDYGQTDEGTFFYVMEYLNGLNLGELVSRYGPMPEERVIYLLTQVCDGLAEAHAVGLIHRDIKPTNIFCTQAGRRYDVAKLLDFGLVMDTNQAPSSGVRENGPVGTLSFMAPEQRSGLLAIDERADLFGLGGVAYYLLTGHAPFADGNGPWRPIARIPEAIDPPSKFRPELYRDLEQVVLRCLAEDPADRYPNAESLKDALTSCASADKWEMGRAHGWWQQVIAAR